MLFFFCKAFTLIEILIVIAIMGLLSALVIPNLEDLTKRSNGMKCTQNLRMIQMAKSNYAIEFAGEGSPDYTSTNSDSVLRIDTFHSYFTEGFLGVADNCPATSSAYPQASIYDIYSDARCINNAATDDADLTSSYLQEVALPPYSKNGYHDLGRRQ